MTFILFNEDKTEILEVRNTLVGIDPKPWSYRWQWEDYATVENIAVMLTKFQNKLWLPVDSGPNVHPRYDVVEAPAVGDEVSFAFNGDSYPDGQIVKITKTFQVQTSTGKRYRRYKNTGVWLKEGGTWHLRQGHVSTQNPSF